MLEQELLKSFFEARRDGIVYALAAGNLETMVSSRAHCEEKVKGTHIIMYLMASKDRYQEDEHQV